MSLQLIRIWLTLALRFIVRHRRKTIAAGAFIIMGTAVLVLLYSITTGINDTMVVNTTHLHYGHIFVDFGAAPMPVSLPEPMAHLPGLSAALFRFRLTGLLTADSGASPARIYAVNPGKESKTTAISGKIIHGGYPSAADRSILVGKGMLETLGAGIDDTISFTTAAGEPAGPFRVCGVFETGIDHFDDTVAYIPVQSLSEKVKSHADKEAALFFERIEVIADRAKQLRTAISPATDIRTWDQLLPDLVQLIEMNKISMNIIMVLVYILVGFGISNTLTLTIVERYREFGILKALGVTPAELMALVFLENLVVCFMATIAGLLAGALLTGAAAAYGIDFSQWTSYNRYFVVSGVVRPRLTLTGLLWPGILSVGISMLAAYFPSRIAGRRSAAEMMRFS